MRGWGRVRGEDSPSCGVKTVIRSPFCSLAHVHHWAKIRLLIAPGIFNDPTMNLLRVPGTSSSIFSRLPLSLSFSRLRSWVQKCHSHASTSGALASTMPYALPHVFESSSTFMK